MFSRSLATAVASSRSAAALLRQPAVQLQCRRLLSGLQPQQRLQLQQWAVVAQQPRRFLFAGSQSTSGSQKSPQRPISPHVTIYDFPLTALSSIANRVTGCVLAGILFLAAASANFGNPDIASCLHGFKVRPRAHNIRSFFVGSEDIFFDDICDLSGPRRWSSWFGLVGRATLARSLAGRTRTPPYFSSLSKRPLPRVRSVCGGPPEQEAVPILAPIGKFIISWPLVYHFLAGLRHLKWDATATGLESVAKVTQSSRQLIIASVVISAILSVAVYLGPANPAPKPSVLSEE